MVTAFLQVVTETEKTPCQIFVAVLNVKDMFKTELLFGIRAYNYTLDTGHNAQCRSIYQFHIVI